MFIDKSQVGLEIDSDTLRVVEVKRTSRGVSLRRLASTSTPAGAVQGDRIMDPNAVGEAVKHLFATHGIKGHRVAVAIPARLAVSRSVKLPLLSPAEMPAVIKGELEHYRMIPPGEADFDYLVLDGNGKPGEPVPVLLLAAEKRVVEGYRQTLQAANLSLQSLETHPMACLRALFPKLCARPGVALLAVGSFSSELAVLQEGHLRYCRRIDVGADDLMSTPSEGEAKPAAASATPRAHGNLEALAHEIRRSLEFYQRENPQANAITQLVVASDRARTSGLAENLAKMLGMEVEVGQPFDMVYHDAREFPQTYLDEVGPGFTAALGLALTAVDGYDAAPRSDLTAHNSEAAVARVAPRMLTIALIISIATILIAGLIAAFLARKAGDADHELMHTKMKLAQLATEERRQIALLSRVQVATEMVQVKGLPWSEILSRISLAIPPQVAITALGQTGDGSLRIEGQAMSSEFVPRVMESLGRSPILRVPTLVYMQTESNGRTRFQVQARLAPPKMREQPPSFRKEELP